MLLLCLHNSASLACVEEGDKCVLGIFPHSSLRQIEAIYGPFADELGLILDRDVQLKSASSTEKYLRMLGHGYFDIALVGFGHFVNHAEGAGYIPLAKREQGVRFSVIALPHSGIKQIGDLAKRRFGLVPDAPGTFLVAKKFLKRYQLGEKVLQEYYGSQQACIYAMTAQLVDSCAIAEPVVQIFEAKLGFTFKKLHRTEPILNIAFVAHKRLSREQHNDVREYLVSRDGLIDASLADFDSFRQILQQLNGRL